MVSTPRHGGQSGGSSHVVEVHDCRGGCCRVGSVAGGAVDSGADSRGQPLTQESFQDPDMLQCKASLGDEDK